MNVSIQSIRGITDVGNRTTAAGTTYTANALNQYTQVGAVVPTYDLNGNLSGDGTATYTFNPENRLTQVVKGGITTTFTYDALGRRASKTVSGITTKFLYDGADLLAETNSAGTITGLYLHGPGIDEPLELKRGTTTSYYSADGLGSIAHLTDSAGTIVEQYSYDLFGLPTIKNSTGTTLTTSALGNPFLFTGREWDAETGLYYYRARYYQPTLGRFLSRDPLSYLPDVNLYRYVGNNPLTFTDPFGFEKARNQGLHTFLDLIGLIEGVGTPADLLNALVYAFEGNGGQALLAAGAAIPIAGLAATGGKWAQRGAKVLGNEAGFVGAARSAAAAGRTGRQARLRSLLADSNVSRADKGWIEQELNAIRRGDRTVVRVPPGKELAHRRGFEAHKGYSYKYSDLQAEDIHGIQTRIERGWE